MMRMGAKLNLQSTNESGKVGLLHVVVNCKLKGNTPNADWVGIASMLLKKSADATLLNSDGKTPLELAQEADDTLLIGCFEGGFTG